ncbi:MAG: AraC family transcriptional regulator, partial [Eubacterium sp.]
MKYSYEVVNYDKNIPGRVLMQHKPGRRCNTFLHWHKELEFVYMIDGFMNLNIGGRDLQINDGEFYFCNSEEIHITSVPDDERVVKYIVLLLSHEYMRTFCKNIDKIEFKIQEDVNEDFIALFRRLIKISENDDEYKALSVSAVFMEIYHILLSRCITEKKDHITSNVPDNFIYAKKAIEYIGQNYSKNITLKDMADYVGLTPAYFSKYFKNITELNFIQYLNRVRLKHALNSMMYEGKTGTKAAMDNGFANVKSFIELCKKVYGCTPSEYKKLY